MKRLAILGASGHGRVVADTAELCGWESIVFYDDAYPGLALNGNWVVAGTSEELMQHLETFDAVLVAIGHNRARLSKLEELLSRGASVATLVHPTATISRYASIGAGSVVFGGVVVNAYAQIGMGCILNTLCSVDHDSVLARAVHVSPGAHLAGGVRVGEASWIGIGASIRQLIHIGDDVTIGAGAAVVRDVPDNIVAFGVPAHFE
ncbi:acetyltransferase [Pseudomonas sp. Marseille-Q8238]